MPQKPFLFFLFISSFYLFSVDKGGGWVIKDKKYCQDKIVKEYLLSHVYKEVSGDSDKKYL